MVHQKINNKQNSGNSVLSRTKSLITNCQFYKQRREIFKIFLSSFNFCADIFLFTRLRFPLLGNMCFSQNFDTQYGCNSVFKDIIKSQEINQQQNECFEQNQDTIQIKILQIALQQINSDSLSLLNTIKTFTPIYLLVTLCLNITQLFSKKQKSFKINFFLVIIAILDLMYFNDFYQFSMMNPNIQDIQLFNSHFSQYPQYEHEYGEYNSLLLAKNSIFKQTNKFIVAIFSISKLFAIIMIFYQLYNSIFSLQSISNFKNKIIKLRKESLGILTNLNPVFNLKNNQVNNIDKSTAYGSTKPTQSSQISSKISQNIISQKNQNLSSSKKFSSDCQETKNSPSFIKINKDLVEQTSNGIIQENNQTFIKTEQNKKSKNANKKLQKNQQTQNKNINQELINFQIMNNDSSENLKSFDDRQENNDNKLNEDKVLKNEDISNKIIQKEISQNSPQNEQNDIQNINIELKLQKEQIVTSSNLIQNQNQQQQQVHKIIQNSSQISELNKDSSLIDKTKLSQDFNLVEEYFDSKFCIIQNKKSNSAYLNSSQETTISPFLEASQINSLNISSSIQLQCLRQSSNETQEFFLNDSAQMSLDQSNLTQKNLESPSLSHNQPNIVIIQNEQSDIIDSNRQIDSIEKVTNEQIINQQGNDDLRKKCALKQKTQKVEKKKIISQLTCQKYQNNKIYSSQQNSYNSPMNNNQIQSIQDLNLINPSGNINQYISIYEQQLHQEDLDISTNDESNFNSINSNYDSTSISKQNHQENSMTLKNLSQHLLNQQVAQVLAYQKGQYKADQKKQELKNLSLNETNSDISINYSNYQNAQYQEEKCYTDVKKEGLNFIRRTSGQINSNKFDRQYLYIEDDYQQTSQINIDQNSNSDLMNYPTQQQNIKYGFNHEENLPEEKQRKTPFELFYDQQCLMDEEYDEEEELDQCHENSDEDDEDEEEDEDEDDDDDEEEDEDEEFDYSHQYNKNSYYNQESIENNSDTSACVQSHLHYTTEIFSVDELKSQFGDYLDLTNDENSLIQQSNFDQTSRKFNLSQLSSCQDFSSVQQDAAAADGKKKKRKKKKSKEQKRKKRCKRKLQKKIENSMKLSQQQEIIQQSVQSCQNPQETPNTLKEEGKTKKKNSKNKKQNNKNAQNSDLNFTSDLQTEGDIPLSFNQNQNNLKKFLDENLLEYYTFNVIISQGMIINIYITDFYQFDEQFEMQSSMYGIDSHTILDAKINIIFEIMSENLYPQMTPFFEDLIDQYSLVKITNFQLIMEKLQSEYKKMDILTI